MPRPCGGLEKIMTNSERKLNSYKPSYVDECLNQLEQRCAAQAAAIDNLNRTVVELEQTNAENLEELKRLSEREELISKTLYDVTVRARKLEERTEQKCAETIEKTDKVSQELMESVDSFRKALLDDSADPLKAVSDYIETLNRLFESAGSIDAAFGIKKNSVFNLDDLNRTSYDLAEVCKELGIMPAPPPQFEPANTEQTPPDNDVPTP